MSYSLEKFAEVLEALSKETDWPLRPDEDPIEYGIFTAKMRATRFGYKQAAEMLRGSPSSLWTVWPMYFPDPEKKLISNNDNDGKTSYYKCPNGHVIEWNIGDPLKCSECNADLVVVSNEPTISDVSERRIEHHE